MPTDKTTLKAETLRALAEPLAGHWDSPDADMIAEYAGRSRANLMHGEMTDFLLANRQYMAGRSDLDLVAWQTAAKERIRWLSVQLALLEADKDERVAALEECAKIADDEAARNDRIADERHRSDTNREAAWQQATASRRIAKKIRSLGKDQAS